MHHRQARLPEVPILPDQRSRRCGPATAIALLAVLAAATARAQAPDPIRPDPELTPGATVIVGHDAMCTPGYSKGVRYVPADVHRLVFREYGLIGVRTRDYEVDHLVPLALGGSNDLRNLWPESRRTQPWNARVKDRLEAHLHEMVCWGGLDLRTAQQAFRTDWIAAYRHYLGAPEASATRRRHRRGHERHRRRWWHSR